MDNFFLLSRRENEENKLDFNDLQNKKNRNGKSPKRSQALDELSMRTFKQTGFVNSDSSTLTNINQVNHRTNHTLR